MHTPLTEQTKNILSRANLMKTKKGVRIINCARGGLVDELAVRDLLVSGHIAGAGFDVFTEEPAKANVLFGAPNLVSTPHLGAATVEAQENVALQVAEQMADYLLTGAVANSLNMPNVSAEDAPKLAPYLDLAEKLGSFAGQLTDTDIKAVSIEYEGQVAALNIKPLSQVALMGVLRPQLNSVNMVNAPVIARERGIEVAEVKHERASDYTFDDPPHRHDREVHALGHRHAVRRQASAHRRHQGHRDRGRVRAAHALHHQRRQAGLHRPARHPARREQGQHRDLPSRPRQAGRLGDRAGPGRPADLARATGKIAAVEGVVQAKVLGF